MLSGLVMALSVAMSPGQCTTCGPGGGMSFSPGMASGSWVAGTGGGYDPYTASGGAGRCGDQLYPYDSPEPWLHGYFQEMPAYAGHAAFRPHNYKHVLAQTQAASRWGIPTAMPVSHQWYHRYRQRAGMHPGWDTKLSSTGLSGQQNYAAAPPAQPQVVQTSVPQSYFQPTSEAAFQRGYTGTPIPGIATPTYQQSLATFQSIPTSSQMTSERFQALQSQLEQQTFQLQALQQQLQQRQTYEQAHDQFNSQTWAQPNHARFTDNRTSMSGTDNSFAGPSSSPQAQPGMMNQSQPYPSHQAPAYTSQPYTTGPAAPNMLPPVSAQPVAPQYPPAGPQYAPQYPPAGPQYAPQYPPAGLQYAPGQPAPMTVPQNTGYGMPQGTPHAVLPSSPLMPGMPSLQNYLQNRAGAAGYPHQTGYQSPPIQSYGPGTMDSAMTPARGIPQGGYQTQPIPTVTPGRYPTVPVTQ